MHIAMYTPAWPPAKHSNGIISYVHHIRAGMLAQGHRVSLFTGKVDDEDLSPDVHRVSYQLGGWRRVRRAIASRLPWLLKDRDTWPHLLGRAVRQVHAGKPIDVLEMEESFGWCEVVREVSGIPVVVKLHGPAFLTMPDDVHEGAGLARVEAEGRALRAMRYITAPSNATLSLTTAHYGLAPAASKPIANPIVPSPDSENWSLATCDRRTLFFVGRFERLKGADFVLQAFHRLLQTHPDLKLVFAGPDNGIEGPDGKLLKFHAYADTIFDAAQKSRITFLGQTPAQRIPQLRREALVTLVASRFDNYPTTVLEAQLQSCPLVAMQAGGVGEQIEHGVTGFLVGPGDLDDFCVQIRRVLDDPEAAAEMGRRARSVVIERNAPKRIVDETLAFYRQAINAAA